MEQAAPAVHDWQSAEYARAWVADAETRDPERAPGLALLARLIPRPADAPIRVLDLGAGYGIVTATVLAAFPRAQVALVDYSEAMLAHARTRLAPHAARLQYVVTDLSAPDWRASVAGPFDAVVSASATHTLRVPERIAALYGEIAGLLAPGGAFLNLDHVSAGGPRIEAQFAALATRPARHLVHEHPRAGLRYPAGLIAQLGWLRATGFAEVDCFWKHLHLALFGGFMRP
ncbi:MAG TPA: methyltransferase domain-containing protein [Chloroflexota bacterium]|jgi:tRNA (cmo5U34)-methyltransferase